MTSSWYKYAGPGELEGGRAGSLWLRGGLGVSVTSELCDPNSGLWGPGGQSPALPLLTAASTDVFTQDCPDVKTGNSQCLQWTGPCGRTGKVCIATRR